MMRRCALAIAVVLLSAGSGQAGNLIVNGSFEAPGFSTPPNYRYLSNGDTSITGWTVIDDGIGEPLYWMNKIDSNYAPLIVDGNYAVHINQGSGIWTAFSATAGTRYRLTFWAAGGASPGLTVTPLVITAGGFTTSLTISSSGGYQTVDFVASSSDPTTMLKFFNDSPPGDFKAYSLDDVKLTAVPEPMSLLSVGLGLIGFAGYAGWRRRRRRGSGA